jgi:ATP-dependent protease HslVU (ClpYQ) peptidase subunit
MTIIAAIHTTDSVLMGGDSAQSSNGLISIIQDSKVFLNGDYVFGVAGSPRLAGILRYEFRPPQKIQSMTWKEFLVRSFLPKLKVALGSESALENSSILVGTKGGGIFEVNSGWFVEQSRESYAAIGSGASYALGSFHSTSGNPRRRLLKAMHAAAHLNAYVRPPFTVLELPQAGLDEAIWGSIAEFADPEAKYEIDPDDHG